MIDRLPQLWYNRYILRRIKMRLKFLGNGSGFSDYKVGHTSAYFNKGEDLYVIDLPMSSFYKLKKKELNTYKSINVLITHTHGDHISGLGLFLQYCYFVLKLKITIIAPSQGVLDDINTVLRIEGNDPAWYSIVLSETTEFKSILTEHSPQLAGKCFGYVFKLDDKQIIYSGDTASIDAFVDYFNPDAELYLDTSVYYGQIHLLIKDIVEMDFGEMEVYLMHLDDVQAARRFLGKVHMQDFKAFNVNLAKVEEN